MRIAGVEIDKDMELRCLCPPELAIHEGDLCVVDCSPALEYGPLTRLREADVPEAEAKALPRVLRRATLQDQARARENVVYAKMATDTCLRTIEQSKLDMQIVRVRHSFDRKAVTILFTAEERIQFRDLVRDLSRALNARVELRQIGVRDAAGVIGGVGVCGRDLCCSRWLKTFEAVNVKMAKNQRLSLNPNTISGMCGRLKCCLRYENDVYTDVGRALPRDGAPVACPGGRGCVIDKNVLGQRLKVRMEDGRILDFAASEVRAVPDPLRAGRPDPAREDDRETDKEDE